jgi:hypothetical protein
MAPFDLKVSARIACIAAISLCFSACGLGSDMDVGDEKGPQKGGTGGDSATGGATATGGVAATGGLGAVTGGTSGAGGTPGAGGTTATGGNKATGGIRITSGDGGAAGGAPATGGVAGTGGVQGIPCGKNICGPGLLCCNPSCGICAGPNMGCTQQACEDPPAGVPCGNTVCAAGETCCNPSCSICAPKGGGCTQQVCEPTKPCTVNGDCRVEADYCTGCNCRALGTAETLPACTTPGVQCLIDPCDSKSAVCKDGRCTLQ